jgi:hypothetical protein
MMRVDRDISSHQNSIRKLFRKLSVFLITKSFVVSFVDQPLLGLQRESFGVLSHHSLGSRGVEVWADTGTDWSFSIQRKDWIWKGSSV